MSTPRETEKWSNQMERIVDDMRDMEASGPSSAAAGSVMDAEAALMRAAVDFSYQWGIDQKQQPKIYWLELHITKMKTLTTAALQYAATVESQNH